MRRVLTVPATFDPREIVIVRDTREQRGYTFSRFSEVRVVDGTLSAGDYGLARFPDGPMCERKTISDFAGVVGADRPRYVRELEKLRGRPCSCVVVESSLQEIAMAPWRGRVTAAQVMGSIISWSQRYVPHYLVGDRDAGEAFVLAWLRTWMRHEHARVRAVAEALACEVFNDVVALGGVAEGVTKGF